MGWGEGEGGPTSFGPNSRAEWQRKAKFDLVRVGARVRARVRVWVRARVRARVTNLPLTCSAATGAIAHISMRSTMRAGSGC